jgi:hypothetical protein
LCAAIIKEAGADVVKLEDAELKTFLAAINGDEQAWSPL